MESPKTIYDMARCHSVREILDAFRAGRLIVEENEKKGLATFLFVAGATGDEVLEACLMGMVEGDVVPEDLLNVTPDHNLVVCFILMGFLAYPPTAAQLFKIGSPVEKVLWLVEHGKIAKPTASQLFEQGEDAGVIIVALMSGLVKGPITMEDVKKHKVDVVLIMFAIENNLLDRKPTLKELVNAQASLRDLVHAICHRGLSRMPNNLELLDLGFDVYQVKCLLSEGHIYEAPADKVRSVIENFVKNEKEDNIFKTILMKDDEHECCICLDPKDLLTTCPAGKENHSMCEPCALEVFTSFFTNWRDNPYKGCPICRAPFNI